MLTLPDCIVTTLAVFAPLFSTPVFRHVEILVAGAILTPGRHTVTNALRMMGLAQTRRFQNFHRVLNRANWNSRRAAKVLLGLLVTAFVPEGEVVVGIDETLERRRGKRIAAKGIYRDAARSSKSFFVKSSGLRWITMMLLAPVCWAGRVWALPFFSVLAPSERYDEERGRSHKTVVDWATQMVTQLRHWLPDRTLVVVGDSSYAAIQLLRRCVRFKNPVTLVTRLRLDAALYEPAPARLPGQPRQVGRPRKAGNRLPTLQEVANDEKTTWSTIVVPRWYSQKDRPVEVVSATCLWYPHGQVPVPVRYVLIRDSENALNALNAFPIQALLCTNLLAEPVQILSWFVQRWQLEETFQEVRTHLGVETQRQWSDLAILRTTPALMGLFSFVTLVADRLAAAGKLSVRSAAWYTKEHATFSDAIACVRREIWDHRYHHYHYRRYFRMSPAPADMRKLGYDLFVTMEEALSYTA